MTPLHRLLPLLRGFGGELPFLLCLHLDAVQRAFVTQMVGEFSTMLMMSALSMSSGLKR